VMAADRLGKWKTGMQLTFCITSLVWFAIVPLNPQFPIIGVFRYLSQPDGWLAEISMWLALALTVLSGWNYTWSCRHLLRG
jgi:CDP-diacylglycerol---glycerol-3-phosphate 3-phosphatidyltransferase